MFVFVNGEGIVFQVDTGVANLEKSRTDQSRTAAGKSEDGISKPFTLKNMLLVEVGGDSATSVVATLNRYASPSLFASLAPSTMPEGTAKDFQDISTRLASPLLDMTPPTFRSKEMFSHWRPFSADQGPDTACNLTLSARACESLT